MTTNNQDLAIVKEIIEAICGDKVVLQYAAKPGWLLMKTAERLKGVGAIRLNKNSFITLYIDTKEGYLLADQLKTLDRFEAKVMDIQSKLTGNFVQNKIKLYNEDTIDFVTEVINKVFEDNGVYTGKRIRSANNTSVA